MPESSFPIPVLRNKKRCPYMAIHVECNVGGFATADCFRPQFHENCHFRHKADRRYERLFSGSEKTNDSENFSGLPENITGFLEKPVTVSADSGSNSKNDKYKVALSGTIFQ